MATWREELTEALKENGESWSLIESITLSDAQLDSDFDGGGTYGDPFTV